MSHLLTVILATCFTAPGEYEPRSNYIVLEVQGWDVYVNQRLTNQHLALYEGTLKLLDAKLDEIRRVVPAHALQRVYHVPIWIELDNDHIYPCICYHNSAAWLSANGFHPEKEGAVEICNAEKFQHWALGQPWLVLHELAHAYHHQHLGHEESRLKVAYQAALASNKYNSVLRYNGRRERHYGLKSVREYFAESTEAYFGVNDFYPFNHAELKRHDPRMFQLLQDIWGKPQLKKQYPVLKTNAQ